VIAYVKDIAADLKKLFELKEEPEKMASLLGLLREELDRLDPRDFVVGAQGPFVRLRDTVRGLSNPPHTEDQLQSKLNGYTVANMQHDGPAIARWSQYFLDYADTCDKIMKVLDDYAGRDSRSVTRSFDFVKNAELRKLVERDYRELVQILVPGHAWKSAVIMAGSILEAILYDLLTQDSAQIARTMAASKAPKKKDKTNPGTKVTKDITKDTYDDQWVLAELIDVTFELELLPNEREQVFDHVLRDYRNYVHPKKELRGKYPCTEAEVQLAKGALEVVCNLLEAQVSINS